MSNIGQFFTVSGGGATPTHQIGSQAIANLPYNNANKITFSDGTELISNDPVAAFPYTSDYADAAALGCSTPHPELPGPFFGGYWQLTIVGEGGIAYRPSSPLYVTTSMRGSSSGWYYFTSTDGASWTERLWPNTSVAYTRVFYTAGKFFAVANGASSNAIIYSTDGINWTTWATTAVSTGTVQDMVSNGSTNILFADNGTTCHYSTDSGSTWTNSTAPSSFLGGGACGQGLLVWSQSASMFLAASVTSGLYMTSPTGATWTNQSAIATFNPYANLFAANYRFAASPSLIVVMNTNGFYATSTDGLTWSNHAFISPSRGSLSALYWDGSRFVAFFTQVPYYSTDGINWTVGKWCGGLTQNGFVSSGVYFRYAFNTPGMTKMFRISDVTLTTPAYVICPNIAALPTATMTYYRIK